MRGWWDELWLDKDEVGLQVLTMEEAHDMLSEKIVAYVCAGIAWFFLKKFFILCEEWRILLFYKLSWFQVRLLLSF